MFFLERETESNGFSFSFFPPFFPPDLSEREGDDFLQK